MPMTDQELADLQAKAQQYGIGVPGAVGPDLVAPVQPLPGPVPVVGPEPLIQGGAFPVAVPEPTPAYDEAARQAAAAADVAGIGKALAAPFSAASHLIQGKYLDPTPATSSPSPSTAPEIKRTDTSVYGVQPGKPGAQPQAPSLPPLSMPVPQFGHSDSQIAAAKRAAVDEGTMSAAANIAKANAEEQAADDMRRMEDLQVQERSAMQADMDRARQDYASAKIDPRRLWSSTSAGDHATALVGIVLSGLGSGLTGQPNLALQVIDKAIERDINAQTAEMDKKHNLVGILFQKYGNLVQAQQMARIWLGDQIKMKVDATMASGQAGVDAAHAQFVSAQLDTGQAQLKDQVANQFAAQKLAIEYSQRMMGQGGGGSGERVLPGRVIVPPANPMDPASVTKFIEARNSMGVPGPLPGTVVFVPPGDKVKVSERISGVQGLEQAVSDMKKLAANGVLAPGEKSAEYERLRMVAAEDFQRMNGGQTGGEASAKFEALFPSKWENAYGSHRFAAVDAVIYGQKKAIYGTYAGLDPSYIPTPSVGH